LPVTFTLHKLFIKPLPFGTVEIPLMARTLIVMPTYNEIENLDHMVDALLALPVAGLSLMIVDDNSPDGTGRRADELAAQYPDKISVLHRPGKQGLGRAYTAAFMHAIRTTDVDYLIQMDTDFSHQPKYVPQLIDAIERGGYDVVLGSRYVTGGSVEEKWSPYRKLLSWFANRVYVRTLLNTPAKDATGGFRIWRRETIIGLDLDRIKSNGYVFQVEIAYVAHKLGYKLGEIPIHFPDRRAGLSKMGLDIQVEAALGVFRLLRDHRHLTPAMRRTDAYTQPMPNPA
jgi:dolichol-phosphate mannosyltransferase